MKKFIRFLLIIFVPEAIVYEDVIKKLENENKAAKKEPGYRVSENIR